MSSKITSIVVGLITIVIGYALSRVLLSSAATTGSDTNAPSFAGFQGISDLGPLIFISSVILVGVGLMASGAAGFVGRGPLGSHVMPLALGSAMVVIVASSPLSVIAAPLLGATALAIYGASAYQAHRQSRVLELAA